MKWFCFVVLVFNQLYYSSALFSSVPIENVDGGIEVNFTLNNAVQSGSLYIFFVGCELSYNIEAETNISGFQPASNGTISCALFEFTNLQGCCDSCVTNGSSEGTILVEGPLTAGEEYTCDIFGFVNGVDDTFEMDNLTALTGIPSIPEFEVTVDDDGALNITVESEFNGGDTDLIYSIRITDENDDIVYETNSTTNVIVSGLDNGDYNITVWAINIYGESDSITETVTLDVISDVTVTVATTGTVESTSSNDANIGAIIGGVVGSVVVLVAVVVAIVIPIIIVTVKKNKNRVIRIAPIE